MVHEAQFSSAATSENLPLVVDLEGTLVCSDLKFEAVSASLANAFVRAIEQSRSNDQTAIDPAVLPYDEAVLQELHRAAALGRPIYLISESDSRVASAVAMHLGLFKDCFAGEAAAPLVGAAKAAKLVTVFGEKGFDYIGDSYTDMPVWRRAATAISVRAGKRVERQLTDEALHHKVLVTRRFEWRNWFVQLRVHQYVKNALVFVPVLTAHAFTLRSLWLSFLAFIAFSLCASAVYIVNDVVDLSADRKHPTKSKRPLARGSISSSHALLTAPLLVSVAFMVATAVSYQFALVLSAYLALTTLYTFWLKRKLLADVVVLSMLYTLRVVGGAAAIEVILSEWLLAFSMLIFTSLALIKRYTELTKLLAADLPDPTNRNYRAGDLSVIAAMAAAAGFNAVTVFALYVSSDAVSLLYSRRWLLWLICPVLMHWIGRALVLAHRQVMDDDPIMFALQDRVSFLAIVVIVALTVAAI